MQARLHDSVLHRASQVCFTCKSRKRKCDKALPQCSSCVRKGLACNYVPRTASQSIALTASSAGWYNESGPYLDHTLDYPTLLFLDPDILLQGHIDRPRAESLVPASILLLIGDDNAVHNAANKYFRHVHRWMSFISKKRYYEEYMRPSLVSRPDIVLLTLAIKLINTRPSDSEGNPRSPMYHAAKHFYLEIECSSAFSLPTIQAGVLIALYELGHGIYPAAYMSVAACARMAHAVGISTDRTRQRRRILTLVEAEERRRVRWAIVILDRCDTVVPDMSRNIWTNNGPSFVNIGSSGQPLATADPSFDDGLPANDAAWDDGVVESGHRSSLSSPSTDHMSRFALLCQAATLLGQVLRLTPHASMVDDETHMQLDRTLQSMLAVTLSSDSPDYDQITFIYSTLLALYAPWVKAAKNQSEIDEHSRRAALLVQQLVDRIKLDLIGRDCLLNRDADGMPPWGLYFAYRVCLVLMQSSSDNKDATEIVQRLKGALVSVNLRWRAAGLYLQLLEAHEVLRSA